MSWHLRTKPQPDVPQPVVFAAILPGGGDLRTAPEESPLWQSLEEHHNDSGYRDKRVIVDARNATELSRWPWNFYSQDEPTQQALEEQSSLRLGKCTDESIGHVAITRTDDVFILPPHLARRYAIENTQMRFVGTGETLRNWTPLEYRLIVFPYDSELRPVVPDLAPNSIAYLKPYREVLENVVMHGSVRKKETKTKWYEYSRLARPKFRARPSIVLPEIATHVHALVDDRPVIFHQTVPVIKLSPQATISDHHELAAFLNSSAALFWLKKVCFNKGAGEEEQRDRFVYAGGKIEQLPLPAPIYKEIERVDGSLSAALSALGRACCENGQLLASLTLKKIFEQSGGAYQEWNAAIQGYVLPHVLIATAVENDQGLRTTLTRVIELRESLRSRMIALQEEMDWLVYATYELASDIAWQAPAAPLGREERPFELWARAKSNFAKAVTLVPADWPNERQQLWRKRLELIRDNEHIRRIEQPVYKRRWDEQWKVGNRWQCGQPAYDAELIDAFNWWLSEKAEWWLEQRGDAVSFDKWAAELWKDTRIRAAWPVIAEAQHRLELWKNEQKKNSGRPLVLDPSPSAFTKFFKALVKDQTVPEGIPFGIPYDKLKTKVTAHVKSIRGKLNVPRERFHVTAAGFYRVATPFDAITLSETKSKAGSSLPFE